MRVSDLKYEFRVYKGDICVLYRILTDDNILSFLNVELTDLDFLRGDTRIEISLWNGKSI